MLPMALWYSFHRSAAQDPAALRAQFDRIVDISGLLVVIALIPALNWIGKSVLRKRNMPVLSRFIGWAIFWRAVGLTIFLSIGAASIILLPTVFLIHSKPVGAAATLLVVALIFASTIFSYGWATLRVSRVATPGTETAS